MPRHSKCVVPHCGHARQRKENCGYYARFPKDPERCKKWVEVAGVSDLVHLSVDRLNQVRYICGCHFETNQFTDAAKKRLKYTAIPSIFDPRVIPLHQELLENFPPTNIVKIPTTARQISITEDCPDLLPTINWSRFANLGGNQSAQRQNVNGHDGNLEPSRVDELDTRNPLHERQLEVSAQERISTKKYRVEVANLGAEEGIRGIPMKNLHEGINEEMENIEQNLIMPSTSTRGVKRSRESVVKVRMTKKQLRTTLGMNEVPMTPHKSHLADVLQKTNAELKQKIHELWMSDGK